MDLNNHHMSCKELLEYDWKRLCVLSNVEEIPLRFKHYFGPRFLCVVLLRKAQCAYASGWPRSAKFLGLINFLIFGIEVPLGIKIGPGLVLPHPQGVILGASEIGENVTIYQQVTLGAKSMDVGFDPSKRPQIGSNVILAAGSKVIGGVAVGDNSTVGANAVVLIDIPMNSLAVGVPAVISSRKPQNYERTPNE